MENLCNKCKNRIVMHSFSEGSCIICNKRILSTSTPPDKVCGSCSSGLCVFCGENLEGNLEEFFPIPISDLLSERQYEELKKSWIDSGKQMPWRSFVMENTFVKLDLEKEWWRHLQRSFEFPEKTNVKSLLKALEYIKSQYDSDFTESELANLNERDDAIYSTLLDVLEEECFYDSGV